MADPVMNAEMEVNEMKLTIHPRRARPRKQTMAPAMMAKAEAMMCALSVLAT